MILGVVSFVFAATRNKLESTITLDASQLQLPCTPRFPFTPLFSKQGCKSLTAANYFFLFVIYVEIFSTNTLPFFRMPVSLFIPGQKYSQIHLGMDVTSGLQGVSPRYTVFGHLEFKNSRKCLYFYRDITHTCLSC